MCSEHNRTLFRVSCTMSDLSRLRSQVEHAEALADEVEGKLQRLMTAVKADRASRPQLAPDAIVDEMYVQRLEEEADLAEQELLKLQRTQ